MTAPERLWEPSAERRDASRMAAFLDRVRARHGLALPDYAALHAWSISDPEAFWAEIWDEGEVVAQRRFERVVDDPDRLPGARWFEGARLNYAENLLRGPDDRPALIFRGEAGAPRTLCFGALRREVARLARGLRERGIGPGDRVAAVLPNLPEAVTGLLAAASLGAVWTSCSPDFGVAGILDRFGQIGPRLLLGVDGYAYGGRRFDTRPQLAALREGLPTLETLAVVPYALPEPDLGAVPGAVPYADLLGPDDAPPLSFASLPPDHPLYVLYSSGTTGTPKCIVHGVAGTLVQHLKEHRLHTDLGPDDRLLYFTTCGWMMWNWLVGALATGATLVLYDGSPFHPDGGALFRLVDEAGVSVFGTSARFLAAAEKAGVRPRERLAMPRLRTILSTGSPLPPEGFRYVYRDVKSDVGLASISGGTDIVSCFLLGNPLAPVVAGELQCKGLGMAVEAWSSEGRSVVGEKGELVCTRAAPSMPLGFWGDPDGARFRAAYFERFPGVWHHGDFLEISDRGSAVVHGRSDATLNPGGVRMGTAEIYRPVESLPEIEDALVVGQDWQDDVRVVLFLKLRPGSVLDEALAGRVRAAIRRGASPRHVPAVILAVPDIPYTRSGKKVELAVREVVHGRPVQNREALANPEALEHFRARPELAPPAPDDAP